MGSEAEPELISSIPRLQLFCNTNTHYTLKKSSPPRSGTLTPPLYSSAAVPFRWEEQPGKPRGGGGLGSTSFNSLSSIKPQIDDLIPKCLELPPRLLALDSKLNSPTTVLDGPYNGRPRFQSSSFRIIRKEWNYGSFRRRSFSPEREGEQQLSSLVVTSGRLSKDRSFMGSRRWGKGKIKREAVGLGPSYVFPNDSSIDKELEEDDEEESSCNVKITRIRQSGSVSSYTRSRFWASIYQSLKQVVPWKNRKIKKKDGFVI